MANCMYADMVRIHHGNRCTGWYMERSWICIHVRVLCGGNWLSMRELFSRKAPVSPQMKITDMGWMYKDVHGKLYVRRHGTYASRQ